MGNFYVNITTRKADPDSILQFLKSKKLSVYIIKGPEDYCSIYEEICDEQDTTHISSLLHELSREFNCPAIGMLNHDDDILAYELWSNGEKVDEYDSCPGYFEDDEGRMEPEGGSAELLTELMGEGKNAETVKDILTKGNDSDGFVFAVDRHEALADSLGLPLHTVGYGYRYISEGEIPEDVKAENIIKSISE